MISLMSRRAYFHVAALRDVYALVQTGSQSLGLKSTLADLGIDVRVKLETDAAAAKGISMR